MKTNKTEVAKKLVEVEQERKNLDVRPSDFIKEDNRLYNLENKYRNEYLH